MTAKNDITNDLIKSKISNQNYLNNYDRIFQKGKNNETTTNPTSTSSTKSNGRGKR